MLDVDAVAAKSFLSPRFGGGGFECCLKKRRECERDDAVGLHF